MSGSPWLIQTVITALTLLFGAAIGGIFVRRGSFTSTYELMQRSVTTYETMQRLGDLHLTQMTAERDAAIARADAAERERDAERARSAPLERSLADCQIAKADLERELARLRAGQQP